MSETMTLALAGAAGGLLGTFFFGGLWWTVDKVVASGRPALWLSGSLLLRMCVAMAGFYFVSGGDWRRLVACLAGFLCARLLVTWLTRTPPDRPSRGPAREATHAP